MLDIDHFKRVNDGLGHDVGDEALRFLGAKLASLEGLGIRAYRLGGEEFGILGFVPLIRMKGIVEELREEVHQADIPVGKTRPLKITISAGVTNYDVHTGGSSAPLEVFKKADALLYHAKNSGRNNVKVRGDL